nr:right-handed parallel beta-helix repeat-containing protein [bacterium]
MRYLVLILITILIIPPCFAEVINVPDDFETIQGAINESEDGDTVLVDEGVYRENLNFWGIQILLASRFIFEEDTNLIEETVIDGNREGSVITMTNGEPEGTEIIGLTIRNGAGTRVDIDDEEWYFCGAGVFAIDASPTFRSCVITNNRIDDERSRASGVYIDGGSARFINCLTADNSPGGLSAKNASVELTGCRFIYDSAGINGGEDREIIVRNCLFSGNGLGLRSSDITVEDCVFRENDSGLSLGSTTGDVTGCSFIEIDGNALSLSN